MNKWLYRLASLGLAMGLTTSCEDELSNIGEGIQTSSDVVESEKYYLQFEANTVETPTIYTGKATSGLLGSYSDPVYGDFSADFVTQFRTANGFTFSNTPLNGQIDSVELRLIFSSTGGYVGSDAAPLEVSVFEAPKGFVGSETSDASLAQYADATSLLAEQMITIKGNKTSATGSTTSSILYLPIKLEKELGQRIYDATINNPSYFATQESFSNNLLGGLYVTTTTGRGAVIKVQATELVISYSYASADTTAVGRESFINTKLTAHADGLQSSNTATLLTANDDYTYSKGPSGVQTAITLSKDQMQRLLSKQKETTIGSKWTLADTQLKLNVDNPSDVLLNPPAYMMLMPADSVATYFKQKNTERTAAATSYLSTQYSTTAAYYNFYNISRMITTHLKNHATYSNGTWTVAKDLDLRVIPVERVVSSSSSIYGGTNEVTAAINEYLFPSFVRLKKDEASLKIGVVTSVFK